MVNCPYLTFDKSHCAGCHGWRCTAFGRKKKLSDVSVCQSEEEWGACPRFLDASTTRPSGIGVLGIGISRSVSDISRQRVVVIPQPQALSCEYLGIPPGGEACCFQWCYAGNRPVRSTKTCFSPPSRAECKHFVKAKREGVKSYANI